MHRTRWGIVVGLMLLWSSLAAAQEQGSATRVLLSGFIMLDMGYQAHQNDPNWGDVLRPSTLPAFEDQYGGDGRFFVGVRQSRFGVRTFTPTSLGELRTIFEFDLFGVGPDAGQTTFHIRDIWAELGSVGAGRGWSPFVDIDVFPNQLEYWGPNGMVLTRHPQLRWTPVREGGSNLQIALEQPGASGDKGIYRDRIELSGVMPRFPLPDLAAHYRRDWGRGHVQLAGVLRRIEWDDTLDDSLDFSGGATGWGVNLSAAIPLGRHLFKGGVAYGEGIENYLNDAPADIAAENNPGDPVSPVVGRPLPAIGVMAFFDLNWSDRYTSTIGYSRLQVTNTSGQTLDAFRTGEYALANILVHPLPDLVFGPELQWAQRNNNRDSFTSNDFRVQFSVKYSFSQKCGGQ
jgi:hypothetical protein